MNSQYRQLSEQVYETTSDIVFTTKADLEWLRSKCIELKKRVRLCLHKGADEKMHEMFIALPKGEYIQPHCHFNKVESVLALEGEAKLLLFNEAGQVQQTFFLKAKEVAMFRIPARIFHSLEVMSPVFIFLETTTGPLIREETLSAPWDYKCDDERLSVTGNESMKNDDCFNGKKITNDVF